MSTDSSPRFPNRRAAAQRNRERLIAAARDAYAETGGEASMAEVARRAGVGMATLYRNFADRTELVVAVYESEVDALAAAAAQHGDDTPGEALFAWLREFLAFIPQKWVLAQALMEPGGELHPVVHATRDRLVAAGDPLLLAAQRSGEVRTDLTTIQILELVIAVGRVHGDPDHVAPMLEVVFDGLRARP